MSDLDANSGTSEQVKEATVEEPKIGPEGEMWKAVAESLMELHVNRDVLLPLGAQREATLQLPHTVTSDEWSRMMTMLRAMKSGLVKDEEDDRR